GVEIDGKNLKFLKNCNIPLKNGDFAVVKDKNISIITKTKMHLIFDLEVFDKVKEKMNLRKKSLI
ncbi:MAG: hypothetical protein GXO62_07735, partial [Epsilonproteobacteria bacterium]|nr:hypothetical protein [Campylobacterota bacterium]